MIFDLPQRMLTDKGEGRRAGFEFEFAGLEAGDTSDVIVHLFGGKAVRVNRFSHRVEGTRLGDFAIESDARLLKTNEYRKYLEMVGVDDVESATYVAIEDVIAKIASTCVPYEVSTPPLALENLGAMEELRVALQRNRALGTGASIFYAFGLHINMEAPSLRADDLLLYLRSFLLLHPWLEEVCEIDLLRRVSPYIDPFPEDYTTRVLDPSYAPDEGALISDYLAANPTRNRPLDLLPIFALLRPELVTAAALADEEGLTKPRPAFHYRLPNCRIDDDSWTIATEWNRWMRVEELATQPDLVRQLGAEFVALETIDSGAWRTAWPRHLAAIIPHSEIDPAAF